MPARATSPLARVIQIVGGHGNPSVQVEANRLIGDLAAVTGAQPVLLPAPGLVSTPALRRALIKDSAIGDVMKSWRELDLALVGIGSLEPSPLLRQSGNALSDAEQDQLRAAGAVGDVCLRFFDENGMVVDTPLDQRVVSITPADLQARAQAHRRRRRREQVPGHPGGGARRLGQRPHHRPGHGARPGRGRRPPGHRRARLTREIIHEGLATCQISG